MLFKHYVTDCCNRNPLAGEEKGWEGDWIFLAVAQVGGLEKFDRVFILKPQGIPPTGLFGGTDSSPGSNVPDTSGAFKQALQINLRPT